MAVTSPFYFNGNASGNTDMIREIPIFAVTPGEDFHTGWATGGARDKAGLQQIADVVNVQVPVHVAMPRFYAHQYFNVGKEYSRLSITAFKPIPNFTKDPVGGYMAGATISIVLNTITVKKITPIFQWSGLPIPPQIQKNFLEKKIGRETYIPVAVTFFVAGDADLVE